MNLSSNKYVEKVKIKENIKISESNNRYERTAGFLVIFKFYKPLQQKVGKNVPSKDCGRLAGKQVRETPIFQSKRSPLFTSPQT